MKRKLLDTSHLIDHWNKKGGKSLTIGGHGILAAATLANELIRFRGTNAIVTPVKIEFLCGVQSSQEMELALEYLKHFQVIDDGRLLPQDWVEVTRLAKR